MRWVQLPLLLAVWGELPLPDGAVELPDGASALSDGADPETSHSLMQALESAQRNAVVAESRVRATETAGMTARQRMQAQAKAKFLSLAGVGKGRDGPPSAESVIAMQEMKNKLDGLREGVLDSPYQLSKKFNVEFEKYMGDSDRSIKDTTKELNNLEYIVTDGIRTVAKEHTQAATMMENVPVLAKKMAKKNTKAMNKDLKKYIKAESKNLLKYRKKDHKAAMKNGKITMKLYKKFGKRDKKVKKKIKKLNKKAAKHQRKTKKKLFKHVGKMKKNIFRNLQKLLEVADSSADAEVDTGKEVQKHGDAANFLLENGMTGLNVRKARAEMALETFYNYVDREIGAFTQRAQQKIAAIAAKVLERIQRGRSVALRESEMMDGFFSRYLNRAQTIQKKVKRNFLLEVALAQQVITQETGKNAIGLQKIKAISAQLHKVIMSRDAVLDAMVDKTTRDQTKVHTDLMASVERNFESLIQHLANMAMTVDGVMGVKAGLILADGMSALEKIRIAYESYLAESDEMIIGKYNSLNQVIDTVVKLAMSREGPRALGEAVKVLEAEPKKMKLIVDFLKGKAQETEKLARKGGLLTEAALNAAGLASAGSVQEAEAQAAGGVGMARTDIGSVIVGKSSPVMKDINSWTDHTTGTSNAIKGAMLDAEQALQTAEQRLAKLQGNMTKELTRTDTAVGQVDEATKDADIRTGMMVTNLNELTSRDFGDISADAKQGVRKEEMSGVNNMIRWGQSTKTEVNEIGAIAKKLGQEDDDRWSSLQGTAILEQQEAGTGFQAAGALGAELADYKTAAEGEMDSSAKVLDETTEAAEEERGKLVDEVKQAEQEDEMESKAGLSEVLGKFSDKVAKIQLGIGGAANLANKQLSSQMSSGKQMLTLGLEAAGGTLNSLISKIVMLQQLESGKTLDDALRVAKNAVSMTAATDKNSNGFMVKLGEERERVMQEILTAINTVKLGPGGIEEATAKMKKILQDGVKRLEADQQEEKKMYHNVVSQEQDTMSQAVAAMREKIMGQRSKIGDTTSHLMDGNDGMVAIFASAAADVASRISSEKDALKFAAEGAQASTTDVDEKTVRMKNKIAGEMSGMQVIGKKTESQLDHLIQALDTTSQNVAASRNLYKLQKHKDDMMSRLKDGVASAADLIDNLFAAFSQQVQTGATELVPLRDVVQGQKDLAHMSMNMLETAVDNDEKVVEDLIIEANDVATELEKHVGARKLVMEERFGSLKAQLATLLGAATYQGSGMLERTSDEVQKVINDTAALHHQVFDVIDPRAQGWRNSIQGIMQGMGMFEDQFQMKKPHSLPGLSPEMRKLYTERLQQQVAKSRDLAFKNLDQLQGQMNEQIADLEARTDLTIGQKAAAREALRAQIDKATEGVEDQQRELLKEQTALSVGMGRSMQSMNAAVQRGKNQVGYEMKQMKAPSESAQADQAMSAKEAMRAAMRAAFQSGGSTLFRPSLLETGESTSGGSNFRATLERLRGLDAARDAEDARLDAGLEALR